MFDPRCSAPIPGPGNTDEPFPGRWFCAVASPGGETRHADAESPAAFSEALARATLAWVDYRCDDFNSEAPAAAAQLGFSQHLVASLTGESRLTYEDLDTEMGLKLPSIQVRQLEVTSCPLLMLLRRNLVLTVHPLNVDRRFNQLRRYADAVLRKIPGEAPAEDKLTLLLIRIVDENNERNFEHLSEIEERGDDLNQRLLDPSISRETLGPQIYKMKHALLAYLNALWQTVNVVHALRYGDAELMTDDPRLLDKVGALAADVNTQIGLAEHMSDVLASGLEVLQSIYNNQLQALNNRLALVMTYMTIIGTAVLVPNTLATVFSNPAFSMGPEDAGWYAVLLVVSTVVSTLLAYLWVKRRGWIPKRMD